MNLQQNSTSFFSSQTFRKIGLLLLILYVILLTSLHFLRPDISILSGFVSDYGNGQFSFIFATCLIFLAISKVILAFQMNFKSLFAIPRITLILSALATFFVAIFPTDAPGAKSTIIGQLHNVNAITTFTLSVVYYAMFAFYFRYKPQNAVRWLIFIAHLVAFIFLAIAPQTIQGFAERVFVVLTIIGLGYYNLKLELLNSNKLN